MRRAGSDGSLNEESVKKWCGERLAKYKELTGGVVFIDGQCIQSCWFLARSLTSHSRT